MGAPGSTQGSIRRGGTPRRRARFTVVAVVAETRRLNAAKKTRINTIAFFSPDAPASDRKACESVLRQIAEENGGRFKVVLTTDLTR